MIVAQLLSGLLREWVQEGGGRNKECRPRRRRSGCLLIWAMTILMILCRRRLPLLAVAEAVEVEVTLRPIPTL